MTRPDIIMILTDEERAALWLAAVGCRQSSA